MLNLRIGSKLKLPLPDLDPAAAFAKGGDSEEHLGGVFVPSPNL